MSSIATILISPAATALCGGAAWCMGDIFDFFPKSYERYEWLVDSSSIRVQQPVANPNKQGSLAGKADLRAVCMGRSRGGLMTDALVVNDSNGLLTTLKLTARQAHVGRSGDDILGTIGPCQALLADAVCDSNRLRDHLAGGGAKASLTRSRAAPPVSARPGGLPALQPNGAFIVEALKLKGYSDQVRETRRQNSRPR